MRPLNQAHQDGGGDQGLQRGKVGIGLEVKVRADLVHGPVRKGIQALGKPGLQQGPGTRGYQLVRAHASLSPAEPRSKATPPDRTTSRPDSASASSTSS